MDSGLWRQAEDRWISRFRETLESQHQSDAPSISFDVYARIAFLHFVHGKSEGLREGREQGYADGRAEGYEAGKHAGQSIVRGMMGAGMFGTNRAAKH